MATEIERKFKVIEDKLPELHDGQHFTQGYLSEFPHVRFRIVDQQRVEITMKKNLREGERFELEFDRSDLTTEEISHLISMALYPPIEKIRYRVPFEGLVWEIDVFQGPNLGLITAEVELESTQQHVPFPNWIDAKQELTGNGQYANINLSQNPYCNW